MEQQLKDQMYVESNLQEELDKALLAVDRFTSCTLQLQQQEQHAARKHLLMAAKEIYGLAHRVQLDMSNAHILPHREKLECLYAALTQIICMQWLPVDAAFLISSTIVILLTILHSKVAPNKFILLANLVIGLNKDHSQSYLNQSLNSKVHFSDKRLKLLDVCTCYNYSLLALIHSLLKVSPPWLSGSIESCDEPINMLDLYQIIENMCQSVDASSTSQAFQVLLLWCEKVKSLLNDYIEHNGSHVDANCHFQPLWDICSLLPKKPGRILKFLSMHWEMPVKRVSSLGISILSSVINIFDTIELLASKQVSDALHYIEEHRKDEHLSSGLLCQPVMVSQYSEADHTDIHSVADAVDRLALEGSSEESRLHTISQRNAPASLIIQGQHQHQGAALLLKAVLCAGSWSIRAPYYTLQAILLEGHLSAEKMLDMGAPGLPHALCCGLRSSHLAPTVTGVYKSLVSSLPQHLWSKYFAGHFVHALSNCQGSTQHNLLTLWLPVTLHRYPGVWKSLLQECPNTSVGWRAKMVLLKRVRNHSGGNAINGDEEIVQQNELFGRNDKICSNVDKYEGNVYEHNSRCLQDDPKQALSSIDLIRFGLNHINETVRGEALSYLCQTMKASLPINARDAELVKEFFVYNVSVDSSILRQSMVKSYRHLINRVRDTIDRELKQHPFVLEDTLINEMPQDLVVSSKLLTWFILFLNDQLIMQGNYQRKILSLQLYHETIQAFISENAVKGPHKPNANGLFSNILLFIEKVSTLDDWYCQDVPTHPPVHLNGVLSNNNSNVDFSGFSYDIPLYKTKRENVTGLVLPNTVPNLIELLKDDMNDIREEVEAIFEKIGLFAWTNCAILRENQSVSPTATLQCCSRVECKSPSQHHQQILISCMLKDGLQRCDLPKASDAESGAMLVKVAVKALLQVQVDPAFEDGIRRQVLPDVVPPVPCEHNIVPNTMKGGKFEPNLSPVHVCVMWLHSLQLRARQQLHAARHNLLHAAVSAPVFGTMLAIDGVLQCLEERQNVYFSTLSSKSTANLFKAATTPCTRTMTSIEGVAFDAEVSTSAGANVTSEDSAPTTALAAPSDGGASISVTAVLESIVVLCADLVNFVLETLASASASGTTVAPSFAEMSEAIERIIDECDEKDKASASEASHNGANSGIDKRFSNEKVDVQSIAEDDATDNLCTDNAISGRHQLVLSCCWQILRACCQLCSTWLCLPLHLLASSPSFSSFSQQSSSSIRMALVSVLQRTLIGTRHKGAIEAAKMGLSRAAAAILRRGDDGGGREMLRDMMREVLSREVSPPVLQPSGPLREQHDRSVTRRAAGLALLTQALCVADSNSRSSRGAEPLILHDTLDTLLSNVRHTEQERMVNSGSDCRCSVVLHLLQSLVQQLPHCPRLVDVAAACITAFTSPCWHCRNAGLQLFGSAVVRLVGQKRAPDDTSELNSLTAPEFFCRHSSLTSLLLRLLRRAASRQRHSTGLTQWAANYVCCLSCLNGDRSGKCGKHECTVSSTEGELVAKNICNCGRENGSWDNKMQNNDNYSQNDISAEFDDGVLSDSELPSALVPILCLLSRLSSGVLIQDKPMKELVRSFQEVVLMLVSSSTYNIRLLAAKSLMSLTPNSEQANLVIALLKNICCSGFVNANEQNGFLLAAKTFVERSRATLLDRRELLELVVTVFQDSQVCYANRALACDILLLLEHYQVDVVDSLVEHNDEYLCIPGYLTYMETCVLYKLKGLHECYREEFIMICLNDNDADTVRVCVKFLENNYLEECAEKKIIKFLWQCVFSNELNKNTHMYVKLLVARMHANESRNSNLHCPVMEHFCNINAILTGKHGSSALRDGVLLLAFMLEYKAVQTASGCTSSLAIPSDIFDIFVSRVLNFAHEASSEEYRLCACGCLSVLLPLLLSKRCFLGLLPLKRVVVRLVCDLLTDEDPDIRDEAAASFLSKLPSSQKVPVHPNKALVMFLEVISKLCWDGEDWVLFGSMWTAWWEIVSECSGEKGGINLEGGLFQSSKRNVYREQFIVNCIIEKTIIVIAQNCTSTMKQKIKSMVDKHLQRSSADSKSKHSLDNVNVAYSRSEQFLAMLDSIVSATKM